MSSAERGLLHGTVELLILRTLRREPMHGFAVSRDLAERSEGVVDLKDAALYQALHRMERQGLVESEWGLSEKGKRAKFYRLTSKGRRRLDREASAWNRWAAAVARILAPAGEG
ncbi:MAG: PadR family transcriptional regulator [Gemmatimonadota bacterium]|jgi:transcriptional regulator